MTGSTRARKVSKSRICCQKGNLEGGGKGCEGWMQEKNVCRKGAGMVERKRDERAMGQRSGGRG